MCCSLLEGRILTIIAVFEPVVVSKNLRFRRVNELSAGHFCRKGLHPEAPENIHLWGSIFVSKRSPKNWLCLLTFRGTTQKYTGLSPVYHIFPLGSQIFPKFFLLFMGNQLELHLLDFGNLGMDMIATAMIKDGGFP